PNRTRFPDFPLGKPEWSGQDPDLSLKGTTSPCYNQTIPRETKGKAMVVSTHEPPAAKTNALPPESRQKSTHDRLRGKGPWIMLLFLTMTVSFAAGALFERHVPVLPGRSAHSSRQESSLRLTSSET